MEILAAITKPRSPPPGSPKTDSTEKNIASLSLLPRRHPSSLNSFNMEGVMEEGDLDKNIPGLNGTLTHGHSEGSLPRRWYIDEEEVSAASESPPELEMTDSQKHTGPLAMEPCPLMDSEDCNALEERNVG